MQGDDGWSSRRGDTTGKEEVVIVQEGGIRECVCARLDDEKEGMKKITEGSGYAK